MSKETLESVANAAQIFCRNHGKFDQLSAAVVAHSLDEAAQAKAEAKPKAKAEAKPKAAA